MIALRPSPKARQRAKHIAAEHPRYRDVFVVALTRGKAVEYISASQDGYTEDELLAKQFESAEVAITTATAMNSGASL